MGPITETNVINSQLVLFWKCQQLGIQVKNGTGEHQIASVSLLRDNNGFSRYISLHTFDDGTVRKLKVEVPEEIPDYSPHDFYFNDDASSIWLTQEGDQDYIVVGTGDIRHLNGDAVGAKLHRFKLNNTDSDRIIISCGDDYLLQIYCASDARYTTLDVPKDASENLIVNP